MSEKTYVVTAGENSDYHICGIYSTREKADRAAELYQGTVEEWELDIATACPEGYLPYTVVMDLEGNTTRVERATVDDVNIQRLWSPYGDGKHLHYEMFAKDSTHAIKIANERRVQLIALGKVELSHYTWVRAGMDGSI